MKIVHLRDGEYNTLVISESTEVQVHDIVHLEHIDIMTEDPVIISGDILYIDNEEIGHAGIGVPADFCSYGRWQIPSTRMNLTIALKELYITNIVNGANVCVYGLPKHESGQIQIVPKCKYAGGDLPVVYIEKDSNASTKYSRQPEYLTMEEADKRMQKKREAAKRKLLAGISFPEHFRQEKKDNYDIIVRDFSALLAKLSTLNRIGDVCKVFIDNMDYTLEYYNGNRYQYYACVEKIKPLLLQLEDRELSIWESYGKYPKETLCARVFLAMSDTIMGLHDSDDITIAPLIKQLYLTKQLHELYFAGYTYTVYDYCKRFFLGVQIWDVPTNKFCKKKDEALQFSYKVGLREEDAKKMNVF